MQELEDRWATVEYTSHHLQSNGEIYIHTYTHLLHTDKHLLHTYTPIILSFKSVLFPKSIILSGMHFFKLS